MAAAGQAATLVIGLGVLTALAGCAEEAQPLAGTGGELIRLDPRPGAATGTTEPAELATTTDETAPGTTEPAAPVDPMTGCLDWYRFKIQAADPEVLEVWEDELDEDLVQLVAECDRLVAEEPRRVQDMIEESRRIDEFLRQVAPPSTPPE